jgi:hypothetical protein
MSPPLIAASTRTATDPPVVSSHVVGEIDRASPHLKLMDQLVPKDLPEVIRKALEIWFLFS